MIRNLHKRGISWKLGADAIGRLMQYLLLWFAARRLGLAYFGDFTFALSAGYIMAQLSDFGLQLYVQRELSLLVVPGERARSRFTDEQAAQRIVGSGLMLKAGLSAIAISLLTVLVIVEPISAKMPVLLIGLATVALTTLDYLAYCFRALDRLAEEARAYVVARFTNLLLGVVLLQTGAMLWGLGIASGIAAVLAVSYSYRRLLLYVRPNWHIDAVLWREMLKKSAAIGVGIVLSMAAFRVDNLLIPFLIKGSVDEALSIYNAAYKLFEITLLVPAAALAACFALLSRAAASYSGGASRAPFKLIMGRLNITLLGLGALAAVVLVLVAVPVVHLLYGSRFAMSASILQILALGCLPMYASYGLSHALIALGKPGAYAWSAFVALLTNVTANSLLLPLIGTVGAAFATVLTEVVMVAFCGGFLIVLLRRGTAVEAARLQNYPSVISLEEIA